MKAGSNKKVNILGEEYTIIVVSKDDKELSSMNYVGYADYTNKTIKIIDMETKRDAHSLKNLDKITKSTLRHELIHSFINESGLANTEWGTNETMVDFFAEQFPKMYKSFKELDILD